MKRPDIFIAYLNSVKGTLEHELETARMIKKYMRLRKSNAY